MSQEAEVASRRDLEAHASLQRLQRTRAKAEDLLMEPKNTIAVEQAGIEKLQRAGVAAGRRHALTEVVP